MCEGGRGRRVWRICHQDVVLFLLSWSGFCVTMPYLLQRGHDVMPVWPRLLNAVRTGLERLHRSVTSSSLIAPPSPLYQQWMMQSCWWEDTCLLLRPWTSIYTSTLKDKRRKEQRVADVKEQRCDVDKPWCSIANSLEGLSFEVGRRRRNGWLDSTSSCLQEYRAL